MGTASTNEEGQQQQAWLAAYASFALGLLAETEVGLEERALLSFLETIRSATKATGSAIFLESPQGQWVCEAVTVEELDQEGSLEQLGSTFPGTGEELGRLLNHEITPLASAPTESAPVSSHHALVYAVWPHTKSGCLLFLAHFAVMVAPPLQRHLSNRRTASWAGEPLPAVDQQFPSEIASVTISVNV